MPGESSLNGVSALSKQLSSHCLCWISPKQCRNIKRFELLRIGTKRVSIFRKTEEETLQFWKETDTFQTQLRLNEGHEHFTFYDGSLFGMSYYKPLDMFSGSDLLIK